MEDEKDCPYCTNGKQLVPGGSSFHLEDCPTCHGTGTIPLRGKSGNDSSGNDGKN